MTNKTILSALIILLLTSCNFNKAFFKPYIIPAKAKSLTLKTATDSTVISFAGKNHQPTITTDSKQRDNIDYTIESVVFKSSDGNNLNGWFIRPKSIVPTITLLHLHGNGGNLLFQYQAICPLTKYGFQIFMFDYSGFGFSEGNATRQNILTDALSALDHIKTRPEVVNTKLVIYGQSLGGNLAAVVATQRQKMIDGLVIEGGFSSYKDMAGHKLPLLGRLLVKKGFSATKSIKEFHKPLLVIHSTEDKEVPFSMGEKIYKSANSPKTFYEIKKCHICGPIFYGDSIATKIKNMLNVK